MTKKLFVFICLICLIGLISFIFRPFPRTDRTSVPTPSLTSLSQTTPSSPLHIKLTFNDVSYIVYYAPISNRPVSLLANFDSPRAAQVIAAENNCSIASSGGFYTIDRKPLGFFKVDGSILSKHSSNTSLLNGYFYIDVSGHPQISATAPSNAPTALQSGPLFTSGNTYPTRIDEQARRILAIETTTGELFITAIVHEDNAFSGPLLSDVPPLVFSIREPLQVQQALNLDGGSASFYRDGSGFSLPELVHVGSIICVE